MSHPIHVVKRLEIVGPYRLRIEFEDGVSRTIDFRPVLEGEIYGPLQDLSLFYEVTVDPEIKTLVWPNGADFDPATLYDWPRLADEMAAMARRWATSRKHPGRAT